MLRFIKRRGYVIQKIRVVHDVLRHRIGLLMKEAENITDIIKQNRKRRSNLKVIVSE
jgi:hypothetical protein